MTKRIQKKLTFITIGFVVVVIALGAFTRLVDAGLGCPDWPGCYGFLGIPLKEATIEKANMAFPDQPYELAKAWPEMVHRYFAGTLGLLVLALFVVALKRRDEANAMVKLSAGLLVLVTFQAALGAWTVTEKLHPAVVMGHLLGGFTTFALLAVLATRQMADSAKASHMINPSFTRFTTIAIVALAIQIALGGWTSANYAALACTDLPICFSGWAQQADFVEGFTLFGHGAETYQYGVISNEAKVAVHASHRIGAIVVSLLIAAFCAKLWFSRRGTASKTFAVVIFSLLLLQVALGVSNVVFHLPLSVAVAHNGVAALLLVSLVAYRTLLWMSRDHREVSHG